MENRVNVSRRNFLKGTAVAATIGGLAPARALGANDKIRIGILGSGGRARSVAEEMLRDPNAEVVAVCDIYEPHRDRGLKLAIPGSTGHLDYREVLDRKDVDAVLIGSPDHWHKQMMVDAVHAGKDVYVEKPIMHSIEEGLEMVRAVKETGRIVQTGTQQRSWPHYLMGKQIVDSGKLGKIIFVHTYWYQKYYKGTAAWLKMPEIDMAKLDWKKFLGNAPDQPFTVEKYVWWRFYWDFGGGILTDLLTHWIDVIQWYLGAPIPKTATTTGDTYVMKWQCPDTISATYEYPGDFMVNFTGALNNSIDDGGIVFRGTDATMKIDRAQMAVYPEGQPQRSGTLTPEPEIHVRSEMDGTYYHAMNFLDCVRTRKTPNGTVEAGFEAARTSWIGNIALKKGMRVAWDAEKNWAV